MKKVILTCAVALMAVFYGCSDDDLLLTDRTSGPTVVGFGSAMETYSYFADEGQVEKQIPVVLIANNGNPLTEDLTITYSVDPSSTAVAGTEYEFASSSNSVTIPAGSSFTTLPILVNTGSFSATEATSLVLNIEPQDGLVGSSTQGQVVVNFVGCISTIQTGAYTGVIQPGSGVLVGSSFQTVVTMDEVNTFHLSGTPPYLPGPNYVAGLDDYGFSFTDICGELTVIPQTLFNYYSNPVTGTAMTTSDGVLNGQQGVVIDENSFALVNRVGGSTVYDMYVIYTKN